MLHLSLEGMAYREVQKVDATSVEKDAHSCD